MLLAKTRSQLASRRLENTVSSDYCCHWGQAQPSLANGVKLMGDQKS